MSIKKSIVVVFMILVSAFAKAETVALPSLSTTQCAMCRAVLESEEDNSTAKGINNGIKYLMVIPYILVGGVFYFVYKSRKKDKEGVSKDSLAE